MSEHDAQRDSSPPPGGFLGKVIAFSLREKFVVIALFLMSVAWGIYVAPFDWRIPGVNRSPVPVDAIPNIGENQQIVFSSWPGRSPRDVEDQISYPLTVALMGLPKIKTVRSTSMFGFSIIYVIFEDAADFYWTRSRILEKLNSLPENALPAGVKPTLGPDATALGQIYWYTLEGRDGDGQPTGGWDLDELRSIQDWTVRYALLSAKGVSEVASVGGFVKEYQIDVDPDAMRAHGVTLDQVAMATRMSNQEVGARTLEINNVEYVIRGLGYVKSVEDLENSVVVVRDHVPIYLKNVARVHLGPAQRRGILDKGGAEAVGGVVVARYGENPLRVIQNVKEKIAEIGPSLPTKTLPDGTVSHVTIVPFYDRTGLIHETLGTLDSALFQEILITVLVILVMIRHFRVSMIISGLLPVAVLLCFIMMKRFDVTANIVALSGIAIAIGTIVDMGIVMCENIVKHLDRADDDANPLIVVRDGAAEVSGAIMTAATTTIISFLPVFTLQYSEGKLFRPLAFTKTFTLIASVVVVMTIIPILSHLFLAKKYRRSSLSAVWIVTAVGGVAAGFLLYWKIAAVMIAFSAYKLFAHRLPRKIKTYVHVASYILVLLFIAQVLTSHWMPLGFRRSFVFNAVAVVVPVSLLLGFFALYQKLYPRLLKLCLDFKVLFLVAPVIIVAVGALGWRGVTPLTGSLPESARNTALVKWLEDLFPGLGSEFMPSLDEGSFLLMPTTMPHASLGEIKDILEKQDMAINAISEVISAVGKAGRAETPLDPAPLSMIETVINYHPEFLSDENGRPKRFKVEPDKNDFVRGVDGEKLLAPDGAPYKVRGTFARDENGNLIEDPDGAVFRLWRPRLDPKLNPGREPWKGVQSPDDIWELIVNAADVPGVTSAPKLQPIETRIVMLQSGMRAPMGVKIQGPSLEAIEAAALAIESELRKVPSIRPKTVVAERIVGKPYLEIVVDREKIARYGIMLQKVLDTIEVGVGGKPLTQTVEGRERYPVRVRYQRERRNSVEALRKILVPTSDGEQIPLGQLAEIKYREGPRSIKGENSFLTGYVFFDKKSGEAETDVVEDAKRHLRDRLADGGLKLPENVSYAFAGNYENQLRAARRLALVIPLCLLVIAILLYLQFRSLVTGLLVFSGVAVAWGGGFILLWLYGKPWFLDVSLLGVSARELFQVGPLNLSVAVWVGFLALFGIATDDGVVMATYITERLKADRIDSVADLKNSIIEAGKLRIRPCLMTTATTLLALLPILTSTGRGSDVMVPMAVPVFGGMMFEIVTTLVVPVLFCAVERLRRPNLS